MNSIYTLRAAGVLGALAVVLGAFGAHGLKGRVDAGLLDGQLLEAYKTGIQYHFYHVLSLFALAVAGSTVWQSRFAGYAALCWCLGIFLFSGSLYLMTLTGMRWLGAITPLGGVSFIVGWAFLVLAAPRQ